ncbi:hypothetical protein GCM10010145_11310 [Streptomyces ruber]|uniref:Uncharacterized protein n=2 Tax=Streptomyces TaxID=1883 RepID=A0A918ER84_9ACTN|nr:hypothetical protein GCM10010145_11310 [Streptomyces ruber]
MNVGYLTPQREWLEHRVYLADDSAEDAIRPALADVTEIALDFLQRQASYAGLVSAMELDKGQMSTACWNESRSRWR